MDYVKLAKDCEISFVTLSEMIFNSLEEAFIEVTKQWEMVLVQQSGRMLPLLKSSNVLIYGLEKKLIPNKDVFILLRFFGLAGKKTVYSLSNKAAVLKALELLLQEAKNLEEQMESFFQEPEELLNASQSPSSLPTNVIPVSRFNNLAASYQRILMHTYEMHEKDYAAAISKDAISALHGQGMDVVNYDGKNDNLFEVREDRKCERTVMIYPAIIRRRDNIIIARGVIFKPWDIDA